MRGEKKKQKKMMRIKERDMIACATKRMGVSPSRICGQEKLIIKLVIKLISVYYS